MSSSEERSALVLELAEEFLERYRNGERPPLREYVDRHPALAAEIKEVFPAMAMMENIAVADESIEENRASKFALPPEASLRQLGDYRIIRVIGHGGMGVVYEAEQVSLGRHVALKVLPNHALHDAKQKRRFEREARAAAKLHHTNIVPVFGVGDHDGVPYYVMQFIQGLGLDAVLEELNRLHASDAPPPTRLATGAEVQLARQDLSAAHVARSLMTGAFQQSAEHDETGIAPMQPSLAQTVDQAAAPGSRANAPMPAKGDSGRHSDSFAVSNSSVSLPGSSASGRKVAGRKQNYWQSVAHVGRQVAEALEYAHQQGVQHRDVKPSNLLLDMRGTVWVTDFGLAKVADPGTENITHTGDILGTLRYMPPEAFEGKSDARSDVYSLGLTLYELLAMRPAFDERDRNKLIRQVTSGEPTPLEKVRHEIPRDLITIVQKSIAREPSRRYATAEDLAADLQRFLDDEPILARRQSLMERYVRWARHHPSIAILGGALTVVLVLATIGSLLAARHFNQLHQEAMRQETIANNQRQVAQTKEKEATTARDEALQTRNAAARQAAGLLLDRGIEDARSGEPARALHLFVRALRTLPADDPLTSPLERVIRANLTSWSETVPALEHIWPSRPQYTKIAFTQDGEMIAMAVGKNEIQCFRTDTDRPVGPRIKISLGLGLGSPMEFAPDGRSLWVASTDRDITAKKWGIHRFDPVSGRSIQPPIPSSGPVMLLIVAPDGRHVVGAPFGLHPEDGDGVADSSKTHRWRTESIVVWEAATGRVVRKVDVSAQRELKTSNQSPDIFVSLSPDGTSVHAWVQRGLNRFEQMNFSLEGSDPPTRVELPAVVSDAPWKIHFQSNMRTGLAIKDDQLYRWSATKPGVLGAGIPTPFRSMLYAPSADGRSVVSQNEGRVFDTGCWPPRPTGVRFAHPGWQRTDFEHSPDGRFAATWDAKSGGDVGDGRLWRLPRPHSRPALPPSESARQTDRTNSFHASQLDPRASKALQWFHLKDSNQPNGPFNDVRIVDTTTGAVAAMSVRHAELVREVAVSSDSRYFATASFDATARVWDMATGRPAGPPLSHTNYVATVAFSPDGSILAAGDYGPAGLVKLWDWRTGKEVRPPFRHDDIVLNVTFSPDGRHLAVAKHYDWSNKPELLVWEVASGAEVFRVRYKCPDYLLRESARFRPDGRALAIRDSNGVLRLWEMPSGKLLGERSMDGEGVTRFSPDGRLIAAAANLGVRLLDASTLAPLAAGYLPDPDPITDVAFNADGSHLLTAHVNGSAQLWDLATRKPVGPPAVLNTSIRAVGFSPDGKTCVCVAANGAARRWTVPEPFAEQDLARLDDRVALMTGQRMDDNQGLDAVPAIEWRALRAKFAGAGSTALAPLRSDDHWHDARAADAEQDADALGAEWHLGRLAKLRPTDWTIPARRGRVLVNAGRIDEANAHYAAASRLAKSPVPLADWLRIAAMDSEAAGRKEGALWNLGRAIALTPNDWTLYVLHADFDPARSNAHFDEAIRLGAEAGVVLRAAVRAAESDNWKRTAALFNRIVRDPSLSTQDRYVQALANLKANDVAGYRGVCTAIAKQLPSIGPKLSAIEAHVAAQVFTVGPNATDDWKKPLSWSDHVLARLAAFDKANPDKKALLQRERHHFLVNRGAVLFRAGQFEAAAKALREGMSFHAQGGEFDDWVFLALVENRLGRATAAAKSAAKARSVLEKSKPAGIWAQAEIDLLKAELDATLPPAK